MSLTLLNTILSNPMTWLGIAFGVLMVTYMLDLIDHGIFFALPAFIMCLISAWITPEILNLIIYALLTFSFYHFCGFKRNWFHGCDYDINDDYDDDPPGVR